MKVKRLNPKESAEVQRWEDFVLKNGYMWHSSRWIDVIKKSYGFEDIYLYVEDNNGNIVSVLPLFRVKFPFFKDELVSLPHVEAAGIVNASYFEHYEEFLRKNIKFKQLTIYQFNEKLKNYPYNNIHSVFILDLPKTEEELKRLYRKMERKGLERAINKEIEIIEGLNRANIEQFLSFMKLKMKSFGTPWHKDIFFYNLIKAFEGSITLVIGALNNQPVGAGIAVEYGDIMYKMYYFSPTKYKDTKVGLTIEYYLMEKAIKKGFRLYSLGRSPKNSGPYKYKKKFKPKEYPLYIYSFKENKNILNPIIKPFVGEKYGWASKIVKITPMPVLNLISGSVRKWVY